MRTTIFVCDGGGVETSVLSDLPFKEVPGTDGSVRKADLRTVPGGEVHVVEIRAGGELPMHSSPDVAFGQIVRGRGKVGLPGGGEISFSGPELLIFLPDTEHDFHMIEEDTLLMVCVVYQGDRDPATSRG